MAEIKHFFRYLIRVLQKKRKKLRGDNNSPISHIGDLHDETATLSLHQGGEVINGFGVNGKHRVKAASVWQRT